MSKLTVCHECSELIEFDPKTGVYHCDACGDTALACSECFWIDVDIDKCVYCRLTKSNFVLD